MLKPEELSQRIGIPLDVLSTWRMRRTHGEDIGPKFLKLGPSAPSPVRYRVEDVEEWEGMLAAQNVGRTAPPRRYGESHSAVTGAACGPSGGCLLLSPKRVAERLGVGLGILNAWQKQRYAGEEAGPKFVDLGAPGGGKSFLRYRLCDVEEWEAYRARLVLYAS